MIGTRTIGAIRVSTDMQADRYGPDRQREDITREADRAGLTVSNWVEEAVSGTDHDRAAENRYYQLARQHAGLNVIFSHPNRVGRHVEVTVGIARQLHALGATVWIAGMGSLRDKRNWKYFLRDAAEAESDHSDIVERLQRGKYDKAMHNRWPHGAAPYGYQIVRDGRGKSVTLEPNPETAPVVQRIFKLALTGQGSGKIALELTKAGIPSPRAYKGGGHWTHRAVLYTLANSGYTGRREFRALTGEVAVVTFPPLVSVADWQAAQEQVKSRHEHRPARTSRPALFAGHLRCGVCGGSMNVDINKPVGYKEYIYYRCIHATRSADYALVRGGRICSETRGFRADAADVEGWALFCEAMTDPQFLAATVHRDRPAAPDHSARITELKALMAQAVQRAVTHNLPDDVLAATLAPLREEVAHLERDAARLPLNETPDMQELAAAMAEHLPTLQTLEQRRAELDIWYARLTLSKSEPPKLQITVKHG